MTISSTPSNVMWISYPSGGGRKTLASGNTKFNFRNGIVTLPDGTTENMSNSMDNLGIDWIRNIFLFIADTTANIQIFPSGAVFELDQCATHHFEDLELDSMNLIIQSGFIPDKTTILLVASNTPKGYNPAFFVSHSEGIVNTMNTTDTAQPILLKHLPTYQYNTFAFTNQGANPVNINITHKEEPSSSFISRRQFPQTIGSSDTVWYYMNNEHHHVTRITAVNTNVGSASTIQLQWIGAS